MCEHNRFLIQIHGKKQQLFYLLLKPFGRCLSTAREIKGDNTFGHVRPSICPLSVCLHMENHHDTWNTVQDLRPKAARSG